MSKVTYTAQTVKIPAKVGLTSLISVGPDRPVLRGNYFSISRSDDKFEAIHVANMWAENLQHLVDTKVLLNHLIEGVLYEHKGRKWFLVTDPRVPEDYLYNRFCFTRTHRPPLEIAEDMFHRIGGDIHGELEQWTNPESYWAKRGRHYHPLESGVILSNIRTNIVNVS